MRIIAGSLRRRVLATPPDAKTTRPMPDQVREAVFNLLRGHTEGVEVLDAFAGTGAVGLEAISRGAARCVFVERDRGIAGVLRQNIDALGVSDRAELVIGDALGIGALARCPRPAHLVFFDPPYPLVRDAGTWKRVRDQFAKYIACLDDTGYAVLRTPWPFVHVEAGHDDSEDTPVRGKRKRRREYAPGDEIIELGEGETPEMVLDEADEESEKPAKPEPKCTPGDLHVPGALGPETHTYGSMAVHLYMRERNDSGM